MNTFHEDPERIPVIVSALRTPIGRYGGVLKDVRPDDLAARIIAALLQHAGLQGEGVDEVIFGCANQAGEDNRNVARMASLLAGLPDTVPGVTVNRLCASSLTAIAMGAAQIRCGEAEVVIAGGVESMSRAPYVLPKRTETAVSFGNLTAYDTALGWRFPNARLAQKFPLESMGETAENIAERTGISRVEQDAYALESHRRAVHARTEGIFTGEIVPVEVARKNADPVIIDQDEQPRADTSAAKLAALSPAFRKGGTVTAGNSSSLNDGAAGVLLMSARRARETGCTPMARYVSSASAGVDPRLMGLGPIPATRTALKRAELDLKDIGLIELNEAFAVQALAVMRELGLDPQRVNPNGGAIALGHPLGCSGARIAATLLHEMGRRDVRYGLATMCVGVGQGVSVIFERV